MNETREIVGWQCAASQVSLAKMKIALGCHVTVQYPIVIHFRFQTSRLYLFFELRRNLSKDLPFS